MSAAQRGLVPRYIERVTPAHPVALSRAYYRWTREGHRVDGSLICPHEDHLRCQRSVHLLVMVQPW